MAKVLGSKKQDDGTVTLEVNMKYDEAMRLKGHMDNIHLVSENISDSKANISFRGKNEATKYFLIPRLLRRDLKFKTEVGCQRIETDSKILFVYLIDKKNIK